jgi:hypothetical protein
LHAQPRSRSLGIAASPDRRQAKLTTTPKRLFQVNAVKQAMAVSGLHKVHAAAIADGRIRYREDITDGLENAPAAFRFRQPENIQTPCSRCFLTAETVFKKPSNEERVAKTHGTKS